MITRTNLGSERLAIPYAPVAEYRGLSTDTKPTDCNNGSAFIEIDTGKNYLFDKESGDWIEVESSGSGGGSGSGSLIVSAVYDETLEKLILDKTWKEIYDAYPNVVIEINFQELELPNRVAISIMYLRTDDNTIVYNMELCTHDFTFTADSVDDYPSALID